MERVHPNLLPYGFRYEIHKTVTATEVYLWAGLVGERYVIQSSTAFSQQAEVERTAVQSAYVAGLVTSSVSRFAAHIPPPGGLLVALSIQVGAPVLVGTPLTITITVNEWDAVANLCWLDIRVTCNDGATAVTGKAGLRLHTTCIAVA